MYDNGSSKYSIWNIRITYLIECQLLNWTFSKLNYKPHLVIEEYFTKITKRN